jgi:hypothetical protein
VDLRPSFTLRPISPFDLDAGFVAASGAQWRRIFSIVDLRAARCVSAFFDFVEDQTGDAGSIYCALPVEIFLDRQIIYLAGFGEAQLATAHGVHDFGFALGRPS